MKATKLVLSAVCLVIPGKGRCHKATEVTIKLGDTLVARLTMGGTVNPEQGLREFTRFPSRFKKLNGYETAQLAKLVA